MGDEKVCDRNFRSVDPMTYNEPLSVSVSGEGEGAVVDKVGVAAHRSNPYPTYCFVTDGSKTTGAMLRLGIKALPEGTPVKDLEAYIHAFNKANTSNNPVDLVLAQATAAAVGITTEPEVLEKIESRNAYYLALGQLSAANMLILNQAQQHLDALSPRSRPTPGVIKLTDEHAIDLINTKIKAAWDILESAGHPLALDPLPDPTDSWETVSHALAARIGQLKGIAEAGLMETGL